MYTVSENFYCEQCGANMGVMSQKAFVRSHRHCENCSCHICEEMENDY